MIHQSKQSKTLRRRIQAKRHKRMIKHNERMIKHNERIMRRYLRRLQFRRMINIKKMQLEERRRKAMSKKETAKLNRTLKRRRKR